MTDRSCNFRCFSRHCRKFSLIPQRPQDPEGNVLSVAKTEFGLFILTKANHLSSYDEGKVSTTKKVNDFRKSIIPKATNS